MLDITPELNNFITILYGHGPKMNKTWEQLYPEAFAAITQDVFRMQVTSARAAVPFDQMQLLTFLVYEERVHMNNSKFIHPVSSDSAMKLLTISVSIRVKVLDEYNKCVLAKRAKKKVRND